MPRLRNCAALCLLLGLLLPCLLLPVHATTTGKAVPPSVSAKSAIVIEADSGKTVYSKNADEPLPMASTTKIMTALVALEQASPDHVISVDAEAVGVEGSSVYLTTGEELTLEQLLYALLLESANDAATAIAIGISGSVEDFAAQMNDRARGLGLTKTHFTNPHGLDSEEHYTTAHELAIITREALKNELFRSIVSTYKTTIPQGENENARLLVNHNKMLRIYDGCIGVKTGYTQKSGRSLVSAAERKGVTMIAVTINAPDDWNDHTAMLDYGFSRYRRVTLCHKETILHELPIVGGTQKTVTLGNADALAVSLPVGAGVVSQIIECPRFEYAPLRAGDVCGRVVFYCDLDGNGVSECVGALPLYVLDTIERQEEKKNPFAWFKRLFS